MKRRPKKMVEWNEWMKNRTNKQTRKKNWIRIPVWSYYHCFVFVLFVCLANVWCFKRMKKTNSISLCPLSFSFSLIQNVIWDYKLVDGCGFAFSKFSGLFTVLYTAVLMNRSTYKCNIWIELNTRTKKNDSNDSQATDRKSTIVNGHC